MMVLGFSAGSDAFGISIEYISEVIPLLHVEPSNVDVKGLLGVFDFRGSRIPLFDLRLAKEGVEANAALSTRIILLESRGLSVGLFAENVVELFEVSEGETLAGRAIVVPEDIIPESLYNIFSA